MFHQRRFARLKPTGPMSRSGKIIIDPGTAAIDCLVVDYSAGGACLEAAKAAALPKRFELLYAGSRKKCRVVWATAWRMGVSF
ncbi:PilZ domain-containing protein [Bradyrhizobium prioriisuperbiae]|uniref:PilZ domain-containing protein n=1 Tax=Bradyrhizobium prioriisuperbiae TaxID=2854389 RepID=UPI0028EAEA45|nr:PilZ domain-containing protein [Bradyrhizobium prioritasuperba]